MVTRKQRKSLHKPSDVDWLFDADVVARISEEGRIPHEKRDRFGVAVRRAAHDYLVEVQRPTLNEIRGEIAALGKAVRAVLDGRQGGLTMVVSRLESLSDEARALFFRQDEIPDPADLLDPENGREALKRLYGLCVSSAKVKKSSRQYIDVQYIGPRVPGRPTDYAEMMLVSALGQAFFEATDKMPSRWPSDNDRGPFVALASYVLDLLGIENDSDPNIVRRYLEELAAIE